MIYQKQAVIILEIKVEMISALVVDKTMRKIFSINLVHQIFGEQLLIFKDKQLKAWLLENKNHYKFQKVLALWSQKAKYRRLTMKNKKRNMKKCLNVEKNSSILFSRNSPTLKRKWNRFMKVFNYRRTSI